METTGQGAAESPTRPQRLSMHARTHRLPWKALADVDLQLTSFRGGGRRVALSSCFAISSLGTAHPTLPLSCWSLCLADGTLASEKRRPAFQMQPQPSSSAFPEKEGASQIRFPRRARSIFLLRVRAEAKAHVTQQTTFTRRQ